VDEAFCPSPFEELRFVIKEKIDKHQRLVRKSIESRRGLPRRRAPSYTALTVTRFVPTLSLIALAGLSHADLRSEITAANQKVEKAALAKDVKGAQAALKESLTPDFKYVQGGKSQDAKTFIANFAASVIMMDKVTSHSMRILSLKENGDKATGTIEKKMAGTLKSPDKKTHTVNWTGTFNEEYRKVDGKWKKSMMTAGSQKFVTDGKPVKF